VYRPNWLVFWREEATKARLPRDSFFRVAKTVHHLCIRHRLCMSVASKLLCVRASLCACVRIFGKEGKTQQ